MYGIYQSEYTMQTFEKLPKSSHTFRCNPGADAKLLSEKKINQNNLYFPFIYHQYQASLSLVMLDIGDI